MDGKKPEISVRKRNGKVLSTGSSASRGIAPARSSSAGLSRLIHQYKEKEHLAYRQMDLNGTIDLAPQLSVSYSQLHVEFKIGGRKKYVLKNIMAFAYALGRGDLVSYGKELEFYHIPEAFTPRGRALAEFLAMEAENRKHSRQAWNYDTKDGNRYVHIHSGNMDEFFRAVGTGEFQVEMNYHSLQPWHLTDAPYKPLLSIWGQEDGAALEPEELLYTFGNRYGYLWNEGAIYRMPMEEVREIRPFLEYMNSYKLGEYFVSKGELPAFCRELLPVLERHYQIRRHGFAEKEYLPPKPEYDIYLDAPDKQDVTCEMYVRYGSFQYNIFDKPRMIENRDELAELKQREKVRAWFQNMDFQKKQMVIAGDDGKLYALLAEGMDELARLGNVYVSDALKSIQVTPSPSVSVGVSLKGDLLELTLESEEMPLPEVIEILSSYQPNRKFFRLKSGDFLSMEEDGLAVLSRIQESVSIPAAQWAQGSVLLPKYRALYLDGELNGQNRLYAAKDKAFQALVRNMESVEGNSFEVPKSLGKVLREYQKQGFLWLKTLHANGFGGILADDMGLGKTLQAIAFLLSMQEEMEHAVQAGDGLQESVLQPEEAYREQTGQWEDSLKGSSKKFALIVCPASLVYNWKNEIERFAPSLHPVTVAGTAPERKETIDTAGRQDILITSYDLLRRDEDFYEGYAFCHEIIDEAQYIKNHNTRAAKSVKSIRAGFKIALTGTPIENRLSELWSIFDYLMPGFLYTYSRFREEIEIPVVLGQDEGAAGHLRNMIRPFVLRRLKKDVQKDLPAKLEKPVFTKLEGEQEKLYAAHVQRIKLMLDGQTEEEFASKKIQVLAELTRLRQICCDPSLVYRNYQGESAKLLMCIDLVKNALDGGHRVLLFSQFTTMLSLLQKAMQKENIPFLTLTGSTGKEQRAELVEAFQQGAAPVFCISLKAGGTGLNLTAADIVIHYDPWWNVAVQNQATDRAHRIGQRNPVTVYKLIAKNTIEEKILKLQEKKRELAEQLLGAEGFGGVKLTKEEMMELLGRA